MTESSCWPKTNPHANDGLSKYGPSTEKPRDMMGYGEQPPKFTWNKTNAKVALNFCIHYEAGGEECELHGDSNKRRNVNQETMCDYGARAGFWRLHRLFTKRKLPVTVFAVGMALERNPVVAHALREEQNNKHYPWEIASAGYRGVDYTNSTKENKVDEATEREHLERSVKIHERLLGKRPTGIYYSPGQAPSLSSRQYIVQEGGFKYDSDSTADDLPYWTLNYESKPHLIIPYSIDCSDTRGTSGSANFSTGAEMTKYLKDALRFAVEEGRYDGAPKVLTVGLHCRLATPGRVNGLVDFIDYAKSFSTKDVWICRRQDIAEYWTEHHYPKGVGKPITEDEAKADAAKVNAAKTTPAPSTPPPSNNTKTSEQTVSATTETATSTEDNKDDSEGDAI